MPLRSPAVVLSVVLLACNGSGTTGVAHDAQRPTGDAQDVATGGVTVTVEQGYGAGTFTPGTKIHVWSNVDPQTAVTARWLGATGLPTEWNGSFVVPDHDVTVTPVMVAAPVTLVARKYSLATGSRVVLGHFPVHPAGLALFFHGAQFSVHQLRDNAASTLTMALARAGYAVVAVPSEAETLAGVGGWNPALSGNTDLDNVSALVAALQADGSVPNGAPIVAWGMSSGGIFAHTVGAKLPSDVVVAYCGPGTAEAIAATHARTAWYLAQDDQTLPTSASDSAAFKKELESRGVATDFYIHPPTPLYPERFVRVAGIDAGRSATIAASLRSRGYVDAQGDWRVTGSSITAALDLGGLAGLTDAQRTAVGEEIEIMAADHELYDDVANRMIEFIVTR